MTATLNLPPCAGKNCVSTNGQRHSIECLEQHDAACYGWSMTASEMAERLSRMSNDTIGPEASKMLRMFMGKSAELDEQAAKGSKRQQAMTKENDESGDWFRTTLKAAIEAHALAEQGYRRTSHKHCMVSRIDRADWVFVLATALRRAPADFYVPGEPNPAANWCDYYRRTHSQDTKIVSPTVAKIVPGSGHDPCGYIPQEASKP